MKLVSTTGVLAGYYTDKSIAAPLPGMAEAGYHHIDLSFYNVIYPGSPWIAPGDDWLREVEACAEAAKALHLDFCQAHSPAGEHYQEGEKRDALTLATKRSVIACGILGIPCTVMHAQEYKPDNTQFTARNADWYRQFADLCEKYDVDMLTENSSSVWAPNYLLRTGREMVDFVKAAGIPRLHICWDTGHANCERLNQYDEILTMGDELHAVHIQDNMGNHDHHITPGIGNTNFDRVIEGLLAVGFKGTFTLEDDRTLRPNGAWPNPRQFAREGDRLACFPRELAVKAVRFSREIATWMMESYQIQVE